MAGRFSVEAVFKAVDQYSGVVAKITKQTDKMLSSVQGGVTQLNGMVDKAIGGLKSLGVAAGAIGLVAGAGLAKIGQTGADFEEAIAAVGAVSLMTRKDVADLEKEARRLGGSIEGFGFTAKETANAMELMGKAGFTNAEIIQSIGGLLAAAAAEGMELSEAAGLVSNTLKGMGLQAKDTAMVADVLTLASARTNSSISSLGESMAILSSTARQFKIPFNEAVASVALLQDVGLDASTAGTAVSTMLTKLAAPSKDVAAQMHAMGISFQDAKGNMLPLAQIFGQFEKAGKKAGGNMKAVAFFADLVGLRGQKAALNLKDLFTSGKFGELAKELEGAAGSAKKMATLRMDTLKGDLKLLSNAADDLQISLFDLKGGALRGVVQGVTEWVNANKGLIVQKVQDVVKSIADNMPAIVTWGERIAKAFAIFAVISAAIKVASAAMAVFNAIVALNPIALLVIAIGVAVAAIVAFWPEISDFFSSVWTGIKDIASKVASAVVGAVTAIWEPIKSFLKGAVEFAVGLFITMFPLAIPAMKALFEVAAALGAWLVEKWGPIAAFFSNLWRGISIAFKAEWAIMKKIASDVFEDVKVIWAPIGQFFSDLWDGIAASFKAALGWIVEKIENMVDGLRKLGRGALGWEPPGEPAPAPAAPGGGAGEGAPAVGGGDAPSVSPPGSAYGPPAPISGEITVRAAPGTSAKVTKQPRAGFKMPVAPSGGLAPAH